MKGRSATAQKTISVIYPYIIVFGLYIIYNGHTTPGGGFQGGAILAAIFIIHYIVSPDAQFNVNTLTRIEKILYFLLVLSAFLFILLFNKSLPLSLKQFYMILMNFLIGGEVFCGLSVIFFRFIHFESR